MVEQADPSSFKTLDGGTMFMCRIFWLDENQVVQCAAGVWAMADVVAVTTMPASIMPQMPGPRCCIALDGAQLHAQATFEEVQRAWRVFRRRHTTEIQAIRFTPFSAS